MEEMKRTGDLGKRRRTEERRKDEGTRLQGRRGGRTSTRTS